MPSHLDPSELGKKEYWDAAYEREIENHRSQPTDEGTIWFSDADAEQKMLDFASTLDLPCRDNDTPADIMDRTDIRILDVGTGNGHLLFAMKEDGWQGQMVGVDYSERSVELAQQIQKSKKPQEVPLQYYHYGGDDINFQKWDLLHDNPGLWLGSGFDIVLDKGTFDAISLNSESVDEHGRKGCEVYAEKIAPLMKSDGYLLVTSCNWTTDELRKWLESSSLVFHDTIRFPSFSFGGQVGQSVSSVCFRRKNNPRSN